jgi:hypothetical protein
MPYTRAARSTGRSMLTAIAIAALLTWPAGSVPPQALAATGQEAIFEADPQLYANPLGTLQRLRALGVQVVRLDIPWAAVAPNPLSHKAPRGFNGTRPAAYPTKNWSRFDAIVTAAQQLGITINLDADGGAPLWATGPGAPTDKIYTQWEPSVSLFGAFVRAVGTRYSGSYTPPGAQAPLPPVSYWSIWNEPNYGPSLAPQGVPGQLAIENSPRMYRGLVGAAWSALQATGHGGDTIVFGEVAARGVSRWGVFSGMKPLIFLRALYCADSSYRQLRGSAAAVRGCPASAAGAARFRAQNPALFAASGFSTHPYMRWYTPNRETPPDPNYASLGELGGLERALDRLQQIYGSSFRLPVYNTEFGYITSPPKHPTARSPWLSQSTAAYYLNWAEYLSWRDPRVMSFDQYLLSDPLPASKSNDYGGYASGLLSYSGRPKPSYDAWRLPLYLPVSTTQHGRNIEVWGCVRPAYFAATDAGGGPQTVQIQFQAGSHGPFTTLATEPITDPHGYLDAHVTFPSSGNVRLAWAYPTTDPLFPSGTTVHSRTAQVTVR